MWYYCLEVLCDPSVHIPQVLFCMAEELAVCVYKSRVRCPRTPDMSMHLHFIDDDTPLHFFYFCMDLSYKPAVFVSFFGGLPARNTLKSRCSS